MGPSLTNEIIMNVAFPKLETSGTPLLFMSGEGQSFLGIERFKRNIRFVWNLGEDTGEVIHPMVLVEGNPNHVESWYRIEARHVMNKGELSLQRMTKSGGFTEGSAISSITTSNYPSFLTTHTSRIWLGKFPTKVDTNVSDTIFDQVIINGQRIGLWNYDSMNGIQRGIRPGPDVLTGQDTSLYFDGHGNAVLKPNPRKVKKEVFTIEFSIRTMEENFLLFFANDEKRSIILQFQDGYVLFEVKYNDNQTLVIKSTEKYSTGGWIKIKASRHFLAPSHENAVLVVNNQEYRPLNNMKVNSSDLPNFLHSNYYMFPIFKSNQEEENTPFIGYLKDLFIDEEKQNLLIDTNYSSITPRNVDSIQKMTFNANRYIYTLIDLSKSLNSIGFIFESKQSNGLLIHIRYPIMGLWNEIFGIFLKDGFLYTELKNEEDELSDIRIRSMEKLNDGMQHIVSIIFVDDQYELRIDNEFQSKFKPKERSIQGKGEVHIGGYRKNIYLGSTKINAFTGTMKDLVINHNILPFDHYYSMCWLDR